MPSNAAQTPGNVIHEDQQSVTSSENQKLVEELKTLKQSYLTLQNQRLVEELKVAKENSEVEKTALKDLGRYLNLLYSFTMS